MPLLPSFRTALAALAARRILPTYLTTDQLRDLDASVRQQSFFSAQNYLAQTLDLAKRLVQSILDPRQEPRPDRATPDNPEGLTTVGFNPATARAELRDLFQRLGYDPGDNAGTLQDLASDARLDLVIKTNVELAQGYGHMIQSHDPDVVDAFPAQELVRCESRTKPRDWPFRWKTSAEAAGDYDALRALLDHGRMVARKDSPIWRFLGSSDYWPDALDVTFPPFAFNSGMWVQDVDREDASRLGLDLSSPVRPDLPPFPVHSS